VQSDDVLGSLAGDIRAMHIRLGYIFINLKIFLLDMGAYEEYMDFMRKLRSEIFFPIAERLRKFSITANQLTALSFLCGLISVYFLFRIHWLFVLFALLHLFLDGLDGVLARITETTIRGKFLDQISDRAIIWLVMLKSYFYFGDYIILIFTVLLLAKDLIYLFSRMKYPVWFSRTTVMSIYLFGPVISWAYTLGGLVVGVVAVYSLLLQLAYFLETRKHTFF